MDLVFQGGRADGAFFLENCHYPFDLQVGPLLGTQGEGGRVGPFQTNPRINSANRIVKVLLQAHEVRGLYCEKMVLTKINMVSSPYVQGLSNFQQYTCRHAELDEHKLMAWALKIILHDKVSLLFIV